MTLTIMLLLAAAIALPLVWISRRHSAGKTVKKPLIAHCFSFLCWWQRLPCSDLFAPVLRWQRTLPQLPHPAVWQMDLSMWALRWQLDSAASAAALRYPLRLRQHWAP